MRTILKFNGFWLKKAIITIVIVILAINMPIGEVSAAWGYEDIAAFINSKPEDWQGSFMIVGGDSLMCLNQSLQPKAIKVVLTGYSSTADQTKPDDPFTMASGKHVYDGAIAANFLDFGTKVQIPELFGDKIFIVEDRMNKRFSDRIDIWFPEKYLAKNFGIQEAEVLVLE